MTEQHQITPPPKLVQQWKDQWLNCAAPDVDIQAWLATQAARWGADQELEACCEWIPEQTPWDADKLRAARRPPPSLKEQALAALDDIWERADMSLVNYKTIRAVLEQLDD